MGTVLAGACLGFPTLGAANGLQLNTLFQDHAVLQRDRPIPIWGSGTPGETVTVSLKSSPSSSDTSTAETHVDAQGRWSLMLPATPAGGPYVLAARDGTGDSQSANDVLVGDVFLCSGQSNMEMQVVRSGDSFGEIRGAANKNIRLLNVEHQISAWPLQAFLSPVSWKVASSDTVPEWSAVCFFFARELQSTQHVPMGLIESNWGGANIRPWLSESALRAIGGYDSGLDLLPLYAKDTTAAQLRFAEHWQQWWHT